LSDWRHEWEQTEEAEAKAVAVGEQGRIDGKKLFSIFLNIKLSKYSKSWDYKEGITSCNKRESRRPGPTRCPVSKFCF
jgi:hypothetical protein